MDERLRRHERDAATGDVRARANLLLERVRLGDLSEERLRLCAFLGDPAGRELRSDVPVLTTSRELEEMVAEATMIASFGREVVLRLILAPLEARYALNRPTERRALAEALEQFLIAPSEALAGRVRKAKLALIDTLPDGNYSEVKDALGDHRGLLGGADVVRVWNAPEPDFDVHYRIATAGAVSDLTFRRLSVLGQIKTALSRKAAEEARARVTAEYLELLRREVIPWALGERDPVRERDEARRESGA